MMTLMFVTIICVMVTIIVMARVSVMLDPCHDDIPLFPMSLRLLVTTMRGHVGHPGVVTRHGVVRLSHAPGPAPSLGETGWGAGLIPVTRGGRGQGGHGLSSRGHLEHGHNIRTAVMRHMEALSIWDTNINCAHSFNAVVPKVNDIYLVIYVGLQSSNEKG